MPFFPLVLVSTHGLVSIGACFKGHATGLCLCVSDSVLVNIVVVVPGCSTVAILAQVSRLVCPDVDLRCARELPIQATLFVLYSDLDALLTALKE